MMPLFITIDTEGDALWDNPNTEDIHTENVLCIPRFQEMCEKYGFKPIWLTDYEVAMDERYISYIKEKNKRGLCEVGIHVHAKNNPPLVQLRNEKISGAAYLIEYPDDIMRQKLIYLKEMLETKLECDIKTHRAGRWTMNQQYVDILVQAGIKYDCSVTPGISWKHLEGITSGSSGSDYSKCVYGRQELTSEYGKVIEYPVSVFDCKKLICPDSFGIKPIIRSMRNVIRHTKIWLRPNSSGNLNQMKHILDMISSENLGYAEFMIHSSEFMPGGGPKHQGKKEVDLMFANMDSLFSYAAKKGYIGHTFETWEREKNKH